MQRRVIAASLLLIMLAHGGLELCAMARYVLRATRVDSGELVCTCTCCGDHCPMGDACCCGAPKVPRPEPAGIFFRALGCNPGDAALDGIQLPDSLSFRFLLPESNPPSAVTVAFEFLLVRGPRLSSRAPTPLSPPPQHN